MATNLMARSAAKNLPRLRSRHVAEGRRHQGSDDPRLANNVVRALQQTGYGCLCGVRVAAFGSFVVLHGRVPTFFAKQFALATVQAVPGVSQICDALQISRSEPVRQMAAS